MIDSVQLIYRLKEILGAFDVEVYLVGGCVRDGLVSHPLGDVDLAMKGDALAIAQKVADALSGSYVPMDPQRGIARVVLREGEEYLYTDFASFQGDISQDLTRRDYTVDAMAIPLREFEGAWESPSLIDPCGGFADLKDRTLRAVSVNNLADDPLRLLRGPRLAAEIGLTIGQSTLQAIRQHTLLLDRVAPERVREELCRILDAPGVGSSLRLLDELGLLEVALPELMALKGEEQPKEHYWDVYGHSVETVAALERLLGTSNAPRLGVAEGVDKPTAWQVPLEEHFSERIGGHPRRALAKMAGLLHDVAKPATRSFEANGRMRFFGHAPLGAEMAGAIMGRLRFSARETHMVQRMVEHHLRPGQWSDGDRPTAKAVYRYFRDLGEVALDTIFLNLADHLAARGPILDLAGWKRHVDAAVQVMGQYFEVQEFRAPPKLLTGNDVMERFRLAPGPLVGQMLEAIREAQAVGAVASPEEALEYLERSFVATPLSLGHRPGKML